MTFLKRGKFFFGKFAYLHMESRNLSLYSLFQNPCAKTGKLQELEEDT